MKSFALINFLWELSKKCFQIEGSTDGKWKLMVFPALFLKATFKTVTDQMKTALTT